MHIAAPIAGVKMDWPAFQTFSRTFALAFLSGMEKTIYSKERLFGLGNYEGNHGEDVKELYYHLDNLPTHYYMQYLYKYPQQEFPYNKLKEESRNRSRQEPEYEILNTGVFRQ